MVEHGRATAGLPSHGNRRSATSWPIEIDDLYRKTVEAVSENKALAERCQATLKKARGLLQTASADPADVEALLERVRATLERADRSVLASRRYGPPLAGYSILWVVSCCCSWSSTGRPPGWLGRQTGRPDLTSLVDLAPYWACMLWGGMGAAASALYGLYRHFAQRDFDSEHKIGYFVQPVLGVVVGALVYLAVGALFFVIGEGQSYAAARITVTHPLALVSAMAGFEMRHAYRLLDGAARRLFRAPAPNRRAAARRVRLARAWRKGPSAAPRKLTVLAAHAAGSSPLRLLTPWAASCILPDTRRVSCPRKHCHPAGPIKREKRRVVVRPPAPAEESTAHRRQAQPSAPSGRRGVRRRCPRRGAWAPVARASGRGGTIRDEDYHYIYSDLRRIGVLAGTHLRGAHCSDLRSSLGCPVRRLRAG